MKPLSKLPIYMMSQQPWSLAVEGRLSVAQTNCTHRDIPCRELRFWATWVPSEDKLLALNFKCEKRDNALLLQVVKGVFRDWANVASGVECSPNERVGCFRDTMGTNC